MDAESRSFPLMAKVDLGGVTESTAHCINHVVPGSAFGRATLEEAVEAGGFCSKLRSTTTSSLPYLSSSYSFWGCGHWPV